MRIQIRTGLIALLLAIPVLATAQSYTYEDAANGVPVPLDVGGTNPNAGVEGGLNIFTDRTAFEDAAPAATNTEDFETNNAGGAFQSCATPVNATSNDNCFTPGQFVAGMDLNVSAGANAVMLPPNFVPGLANFVMGAISFADNTFLDFSDSDIQAVGMDVYAGLAPGDVTLTVRNAGGGTIGTATVMGLGVLPNNAFIGIIANEPIAQIEINGLGGNGELVDNIAFGPIATDLARFRAEKDFDDNNTASVEVTLSCNTGLPLEQTTTIEEGDGVNFVVADFTQGELDCAVTEAPVDGYTTSYSTTPPVGAEGGTEPESCSYENLNGGQYSCYITNSLDQVSVEVTKEWVDENPGFNPFNVADAQWSCNNVAFECDDRGSFGCDFGSLNFYTEGSSDTDSFSVYPDWDTGTTCSITEVNLPDGGVEVDDNSCQNITLFPGGGASCTIVNTRLYEGIPTLSQYGLAVLALLMLGMGFVGFRRFV